MGKAESETRVFSNTAISLDGRISTPRYEHVRLGSKLDRTRMRLLRARADAVLVGGRTFRNWPRPLLRQGEVAEERRRPILNAVFTRQGVASALEASAAFPNADAELVVLGPPSLDDATHRALPYVSLETTAEPDIAWALSRLVARGASAILVEGGGELLFQLLHRELLTDLFVTICPLLLGGTGAPSLVDGTGFPANAHPSLSLVSLERIDDELYAHYRVRSRG